MENRARRTQNARNEASEESGQAQISKNEANRTPWRTQNARNEASRAPQRSRNSKNEASLNSWGTQDSENEASLGWWGNAKRVKRSQLRILRNAQVENEPTSRPGRHRPTLNSGPPASRSSPPDPTRRPTGKSFRLTPHPQTAPLHRESRTTDHYPSDSPSCLIAGEKWDRRIRIGETPSGCQAGRNRSMAGARAIELSPASAGRAVG